MYIVVSLRFSAKTEFRVNLHTASHVAKKKQEREDPIRANFLLASPFQTERLLDLTDFYSILFFTTKQLSGHNSAPFWS